MSQFENRALPAIKDSQDYPRLVPAGETVSIPVFGDFVYCKFSDGAVKVQINGKTTQMVSGAERRMGAGTTFDTVTLRNDTAVNKSVIFVIGFGSFDQRIIQGEVVVDPRIKTLDGEFVSDTRVTNDIYVISDYKREPAITRGVTTFLGNYPKPSGFGGAIGPGFFRFDHATGIQYLFIGYDNARVEVYQFDGNGEVVAQSTINFGFTQEQENLRGIAIYDNTVYFVRVDGSTYYIGKTSLSGDSAVVGVNFNSKLSAAGLGTSCTQLFFDNAGNLYGVGAPNDIFEINKNTFDVTDTGNAIQDSDGLSFTPTLGAIRSELGSPDQIDIYSGIFATQIDSFNTSRNLNNNYFAFGVGVLASGQLIVADSPGGISNRLRDDSTVDFYTVEPETFASGEIHYGNASEVCTTVPAFFNPAQLSAARSSAVVDVSYENGIAYVTGEVIKLVLDLLGVDTTGDYMDKITAFKANSRTNIINLNLGGRTFAADEITDNFTDVVFPQTVTITALASLWSDRV